MAKRKSDTLLFVVVVSLAQVATLCASPMTEEAVKTASLYCDQKLAVVSIAAYEEFIDNFKIVLSHLNSGRKLPEGYGNNNLDRCIEESEAILALDSLVSNYDRKRACKFKEIGKLEDYARNYLLKNRRSITLRFFTLFSVNIAIQCKLNLLAHLKQADTEADQLDFIYSMASPTGWNVLTNEFTKKSMKFGASSHPSSNLIYRVAKLVPGLNQIDQIEYMNFGHPMNERTGVKTEIGQYKCKEAQVARLLFGSLEKIIKSCRNLDQFYLNSVLSLARLVHLGIDVDLLNDKHERSPLLHKWLAATSFCQLMVRVKASVSNTDNSTIDYEIIHDDNLLESRRQLYSYVAEFKDITEESEAEVWQSSVPDGKWSQKSKAMFRPGDPNPESVAKRRLEQFLRGLDADFAKSLDA